MLKTPEEWLLEPRFEGLQIMDPDGWRGRQAPSWDKAIGYEEFIMRMSMSTCFFPPDYFSR